MCSSDLPSHGIKNPPPLSGAGFCVTKGHFIAIKGCSCAHPALHKARQNGIIGDAAGKHMKTLRIGYAPREQVLRGEIKKIIEEIEVGG